MSEEAAAEIRRKRVASVLYLTKDPENELNGTSLPALTTLLYGICHNDEKKFAEATRVVELFIARALEEP